ncbi:MAG: sulfatase [Candidatus Methylacidiphilales bacterium]|nr:sulfatase [Candidatus Methylacidiphilales bacterium]
MTRPNLIWIFGDQHRAQALGFRGDPNVCTPNLDRMAAEGLSFDNALVSTPLCCPARGSLLTGCYSHHAVEGHEVQLDPAAPTVAHAFQQQGYNTAWFGKWHLDGFKESKGRAAFHYVPRERRGAFDTWIGYENNNSPFDCWVHGHRGSAYAMEEEKVELQRLAGYETDSLTDLFIRHLEERAATPTVFGTPQPFFAALSVQPPHNPYVAPERWTAGKSTSRISFRPNVPNIPRIRNRAGIDLAGYYAAIECLDWNVGRIFDALERLGLFANTHVLFFSDHGDMHGSLGQFMKTSPFEESIRVPLIMGGIDRSYGIRRGTTPALCTNVDIAPTSLGLCGLRVPEGMAGRDLSALRLSAASAGAAQSTSMPDSAYLQLVDPTCHPDSTDRPWRGLVTDDGWKYVCLEGGQPWLMFNLNEDPYEQANLAHNTAFARRRATMHTRLRKWVEDTQDNFEMVESP